MTASQARGFIGAGSVLADIFANGQPSGRLVEFREVGKFAIKPDADMKEAISKSKEYYGQPVEAVAIPKPTELSMTLTEVNRESIRLAFAAAAAVAINEPAAIVVDELVAAYLGQHVRLKHGNLDKAGLVVTNEAGTTIYEFGKDFEVNYAFGTVKALAGGAIGDGAKLKVNYTANARSGVRLKGSQEASIRARLYFDGINMVDRSPALVTVWEVLLMPTKEVDLLADNWVEIELSGKMKVPAGKDAPYELELLDLAG